MEHEVPEHGLVHLLELRKEDLEIVEVQIDERSPCLGKALAKVELPEGAQLIAVVRDGHAHLGDGSMSLESGDQVLGLLQPGPGGGTTPRAAWPLAALAAGFLVPALAGAGSERAELRIVRVAKGFENPVLVTAPRPEPNRLYVVEQAGRIRVIENGRSSSDSRFSTFGLVSAPKLEQGLLSWRSIPATRRTTASTSTTPIVSGTPGRRVPLEGTRDPEHGRARLLLFGQPFANHNGGQLQFGPDGKLYVGMGDGGSGATRTTTDRIRVRLAKLLRTNPITGSWEIAGYGLRNPWRFSFDRATGDLYIGDVGQNAWRRSTTGLVAHRTATSAGPATREARRTSRWPLDPTEPVVFPIFEYRHDEGCSVTGGYVYRGKLRFRLPAAVTSSATAARAPSRASGSSTARRRTSASSRFAWTSSRRSARTHAVSSTSSP